MQSAENYNNEGQDKHHLMLVLHPCRHLTRALFSFRLHACVCPHATVLGFSDGSCGVTTGSSRSNQSTCVGTIVMCAIVAGMVCDLVGVCCVGNELEYRKRLLSTSN